MDSELKAICTVEKRWAKGCTPAIFSLFVDPSEALLYLGYPEGIGNCSFCEAPFDGKRVHWVRVYTHPIQGSTDPKARCIHGVCVPRPVKLTQILARWGVCDS